MRPDTDLSAHCHPHDGCITCSDEAVPMLVRRLDEARGLALCEDAGGRRETVEIALVAPVTRGDRLLVHAGTAIARTPSADDVGHGDERSEAG